MPTARMFGNRWSWKQRHTGLVEHHGLGNFVPGKPEEGNTMRPTVFSRLLRLYRLAWATLMLGGLWSLVLPPVVISAGEKVGKASKVTQAERDQNYCVASAQTSMARDYVVDSRLKRLVKQPQGWLLATYKTEDELNALIAGLTENLVWSCLTKRGYREFDGFSILPPKGDGWTMDTSSKRVGIPVAFAKTLDNAPAVHQVFAMVSVRDVELRSASREDLVRNLTEHLLREWGPPRYSIVSFQASEDTWLGADCVRYSVTAEDRGVPVLPGTPFTFSVRGFRCVHPHLLLLQPRRVLDVVYSQRFLQGHWIAALDSEVEPFLDSLVFTTMDPSPHVIASFLRYATSLREMNRAPEAAEMLARAEKYRDEPLSGSGTRDLGFKPYTILREYAAVLRMQNREMEAKAIDVVATAYYRKNFVHYLRSLRR